MQQVGFFTPVFYPNQPKSRFEQVAEAADNLLFLGGKKAVVLKDRKVMLCSHASKAAEVALKIALYCTVIIPLIALAVKAVSRHQKHFFISFEAPPNSSAPSSKILPSFYTYNTTSPAKKPITSVERCISSPVANRFFPKDTTGQTKKAREDLFALVEKQPNLIAKKVQITVDGSVMEAYIFGRKDTINNGQWGLYSNGLTGTVGPGVYGYAEKFFNSIDSNFILFDYPGMGANKMPLTKQNVVAAYHAALSFIEDKEKGLGAKEVICWGTSLGGGISGHALKKHTFKDDIRYVVVSDQTFSTLREATKAVVNTYAPSCAGKIAGSAVKAAGWQFSARKLANLTQPHIILHKASTPRPQTKADVQHDGLFGDVDSLAGYLLNIHPANQWQNKRFIGLEAWHCQAFTERERNAIRDAILSSLGR